MNRRELIDELCELEMKEKAFKRALDVTYYDNNKRLKNFEGLKETQKQIKFVKMKLRLLKEMQNENRNTNKPNN